MLLQLRVPLGERLLIQGCGIEIGGGKLTAAAAKFVAEVPLFAVEYGCLARSSAAADEIHWVAIRRSVRAERNVA